MSFRTTAPLDTWPIRTHLLLLVFAVAAPLIGVVGSYIYGDMQQNVAHAKASIRALTQTMVINTGGKITTARETLERMASRPQVRQMDVRHCDHVLQDLLTLNPAYANVTYTDINGLVLCSAVPQPDGKPTNVSKSPWFQRFLKEQRFIVGDPFFGPITGKWVSVFSAPVWNDKHEMVGGVQLPMDLKSFDPKIPGDPLPPGSRYGFQTSAGVLIWRNVNMEGVGRVPKAPAALQMAAVRDGELEAEGADGVMRYFSVATMPETGWTAFVGVPVEAVYGAARRRAVVALLIAVATLTLLIFVTIHIARRISRPISELESAARDLQGGNLEARVEVNGPAEVVAVGTAFNAMADRIQVSTKELEAEIVERKKSEASLQQAASVFKYANEGIMITDPDGIIIDVNQAFTHITGYSRSEAIGNNPSFLKSGRHNAEFYAAMWRGLKEEGSWVSEVWNRRRNGEIYAQMQTISSVLDAEGQVVRYVCLFSDITEIKEHQHQLERIAHYDALTNLPNRVLMADRLRQAMAQVQRHGSLLAVLYLDLDGFKAVNDVFGHDMGDRLLMMLADSMKQALREGDTLARIGGDEFVAVLLDLHSHEDSAPILERLLAAAAAPVHSDGRELRVSASVGVSFFPQEGDDVDADQLMRQADQAMYLAKQAGKNRYHIFDAEHDRSVRGHHESLERIRLALANREFVLHYQPKVNMRSGEVVGVEALIRWQHPERGLLPPATFLPVIDRSPLMIEVGDWVLDAALNQIEAWRGAGLALSVSVNVDALQFEQTGFVDKLREQLARHPGVRPGDLELEVLETSALENISHLSESMLVCREMGVEFALDDFGTGYSSLTYLKRLPAKLLKVDQSFVRDMLDDPEDLAIIEGVLSLALAFRRQTIAEGVETLAHGQMLLRMGCELGQGYVIAKPMPADAVAEWISSWRPEAVWSSCATVNRDEMPLLFAEADHRAWVIQLGLHLHDGQSAPPMNVHQCRFGQWLETIGASRYVNHPACEKIVSLHDDIHRQGTELLDLRQRGFASLAQARMGEIEVLRDELLEQLHQLID